MYRKILVYLTHPYVEAWNFQPRHREKLLTIFPDSQVTVCRRSREFLARLGEAEIVLVWYFKKDWLAQAPRLRHIATPAAGKEWIEPEPGEGLDISFGGFHGLMIAESVTGAVFYFCKAFRLSSHMQEKRKWAQVKISNQLRSLEKARVTILGFGKIGREIGRVLKPFGCVLTGIKRTPGASPDYFTPEDRIAFPGDLPEVLPTTDHIILSLPGGSETTGLIRPDHFRMLPNTSFLYNIGRGNVYREADLVEALQNREIAGAYLDVFETEPLPENSSLWEMNNVLIQPHLSAASPQYLDRFLDELGNRLTRKGGREQTGSVKSGPTGKN